MATHPGYLAIRKESKNVGWPLRFRRDITTHDKKALSHADPSEPFVWALSENGTHIMFPRRWPKHRHLEFFTILRGLWGEKYKLFWWDGRELWHSSIESVTDRFVREFDCVREEAKSDAPL